MRKEHRTINRAWREIRVKCNKNHITRLVAREKANDLKYFMVAATRRWCALICMLWMGCECTLLEFIPTKLFISVLCIRTMCDTSQQLWLNKEKKKWLEHEESEKKIKMACDSNEWKPKINGVECIVRRRLTYTLHSYRRKVSPMSVPSTSSRQQM